MHLLLNTGHILTTDGRKALNREDHQLGYRTTIAHDFEKTIDVLLTNGADVTLEDQYSRTALHTYTGPSSTFQWLAQESEWDIKSLSYDDYMSILLCQGFYYETNGGELCRQLLTTQTLQTLAHATWENLYLLHSLITGWIFATKSSRLSFEDIIMDTIYAGANLHSVMEGGRTPLLFLLEVIGKKPVESGTIQRWLELLNRADVDLLEYGRIENEMHEKQETQWTLLKNLGTSEHKNNCLFEIIQLRIGKTPEDFYIEFEDLYVSTPLAADFWDWVEAPSVEEKIKATPGSWKDD